LRARRHSYPTRRSSDLPGVSLERDQGEGRFVVVRGLDAALNTTSINGMRVPGPEDDSRAVNLDVISSDLLESLEVVKTVTPDMRSEEHTSELQSRENLV